MERIRMARIAAAVGIVGAAGFAGALLLEQAGTARTVGDVLVLAGFVGFGAISLGLILARAGGGRFGQVALSIWLAGSVSLLVAAGVEAVTGNSDNLFFPIGGLLTALGGLLSAVPIIRAGVLRGWRRWAAPAQAVAYLVILVLNIVNGDNWNQPLVELGWPVLAIATGAALLAEPATRPAAAVVAA